MQRSTLTFLLAVCVGLATLPAGEARAIPKSQPISEAKLNGTLKTDPNIGTDKSPLIVKLSTSEKSEDEVEKEAYDRGEKRTLDRDMTTYTRLTAYATLVLLLIAAIQAALFWWQLKMLKITLQDGTRASKAADISAKASQLSADIAMRSMVTSARPYVHHSGIQYISHANQTTGEIFWRLHLQWRNSGNTPTRGLRVFAKFELLDTEKPRDFLFEFESKATANLVGIPPGGGLASTLGDFTGEQLDDVKAGRKFLYIWGKATYQSVFEEAGEHITKFCVQAQNITGDPTKAWDENVPFGIQFAVFGNQNCSDEDCLLA